MTRAIWTALIAILAIAGCSGSRSHRRSASENLPHMRAVMIGRMEAYFGDRQGLIEHTMNVLGYAERIARTEGGDPLIVIAGAIYHDIGIPEARRVHGSSAGKYQEIEGPPIARRILTDIGLKSTQIERICSIIANHHTAHDVETVATPEFRTVWDADALVNYGNRLRTGDQKQRNRIINERFRTETGRKIAGSLAVEADTQAQAAAK